MPATVRFSCGLSHAAAVMALSSFCVWPPAAGFRSEGGSLRLLALTAVDGGALSKHE